MNNLSSNVIDAENNWWGHNSGPSGAGLGSGDAVSSNVDFTPWLSSVAINAGSDQTLYIGYGPTGVTLTAYATGGTGTYSYLWSTGATTQSITVLNSIGVGDHTYTVTATDATGCNSGLDEVIVTVEDVRCGNNNDKVRIYHNGRSICVSPNAIPAHLAHGDEFMLGKIGVPGEGEIPSQFALQQNYPNPFNPTTSIVYSLPVDANVSIEVYNVLGERVAQLVEGRVSAGYYSVPFDASLLSSGVYIYRMAAAGDNGERFLKVEKMMLMK